MEKIKKYRLFWRIVAIAGFIIMLANGIAYFTGWNKVHIPSTAIGAILIALGIVFGQKKNK